MVVAASEYTILNQNTGLESTICYTPFTIYLMKILQSPIIGRRIALPDLHYPQSTSPIAYHYKEF